MESINRERQVRHNQGKVLGGIFVIFFGVMYLLNRTGVDIPHWILSWKSIVIAVGIVTLYKHNFQHFFGYALILIGGLFMINEFAPGTISKGLFLPLLVIMIGVTMIAKATRFFGLQQKKSINTVVFDDDVDVSSNDFIESTTFFGGVTKNVVSKNFQGASLTTYFGGTEMNLTQADISQPITINSTSAFGGVTIIVPSNWEVRSEITTVFGGLDDKRPIMSNEAKDPNKTLTLKGSCFFGGVEIQSYI